MKTLFILFCILSVFLSSGTYIMAGGVDNRSNYSGEYVRTFNRNTATDSIDAIAYNPAGVMKMQDGEYANLSVHYVMKDYTNTVDGIELEQDTPSFVPALFGLIKNKKWAGYFSFTIPAGGGKVDYEHGNATTRLASTGLISQLGGPAIYTSNNEKLSAEGFYYAFTAGGAYKWNDIISISLAGRYIDAHKKARATFQLAPTDLGVANGQPARVAVLDYEDKAEGWGVILGLGIDFEPIYIGMKYETETDLDFKYSVKEDSITGLPAGLLAQMEHPVIDGMKHKRNLPALLSFGLEYTISPRLKVDTGLIYYFQENADWGGAERYVDNGWETSISVEYTFNDSLKGSIGYLHTETGMDVRYALKEAPELNAESFGLGVAYKYNANLKMDFGLGFVSYNGDSYTDLSTDTAMVIGLEKSVKMVSAGIEYRF